MTHSTQQGVFFGEGFSKPVHVLFDEEGSSSDGGLVLLAKLDRKLGLTASLADCVGDRREPGKVRHDVLEMLRQRIFGLALGHPDVRDADRLASDPCLKHACGREPIGGEDLASAPTLCRFENRVRARELVHMQRELASGVIERLHQRCPKPRRVVKRRLPASVYRCKGIIFSAATPGRRVVLQIVGRRVDIELEDAWGDRPRKTQIVAIGERGHLDRGWLREAFDACLVAESQSPSANG